MSRRFVALIVTGLVWVGLAVAQVQGPDAQKPKKEASATEPASVSSPTRPPLAAGRVHKNVACEASKGNHCNVYVPRNYKPGNPVPVLYVFSPTGNAPAELFAAPAEKLGWIVCGSVESANGHEMPYYESIFTAMKTEMEDRFAVHTHRTYFSGMSGGSRAALGLFNSHADIAAGVIAMAAGVAGDGPMTRAAGGACVGTAGSKDPNYMEMVALVDKCADKDMPYLFLDFDGQHDWAPKPLIAKAMEWLDLQYWLQARDLTGARQARRDAVIAQCLKDLARMGQTIEAYETGEMLHRALADDKKALDKTVGLMEAMKPKLAAELEARQAFRDAFASTASESTSYQRVVALQKEADKVSKKYPKTTYGRRATALSGSLTQRLKLFPPDARK